MIRSMTGFGSARAQVGAEEFAVEVKTVNHKFLEVKLRLPRELGALEATAQRLVKDKLGRGAVDVSIKRVTKTAAGLVPQIDFALAEAYKQAFVTLAQKVQLSSEVSLRDLIMQPNVVRLEEPQVDVESASKAAEQALMAALEVLGSMRTKEGLALSADVSARLDTVAGWVSEVERLVPEATRTASDRLKERIAELAPGLAVDPQRLAQEVALLAERTDVAEETTRLASHVAQMRALLQSTEPAGRKLDFLVQEMHREVNTTGSKSQDARISMLVVNLKAELERIREQVQNIE